MKRVVDPLSWVTFAVILGVVPCQVSAAPTNALHTATNQSKPQCTPIPGLYEDWKAEVAQKELRKPVSDVSDEEIERHAKSQRENRVKNLGKNLERIVKMTKPQRQAANERVLWEDKEIMVLVDRFHRAPKALVIARQEGVWLPTDASPNLLKRLAMVAAATSDAFMAAADRACERSAVSRIYIHRPGGLSQRQLHIHVKPGWTLRGTQSADDFYGQVSKHLAEKLNRVQSTKSRYGPSRQRWAALHDPAAQFCPGV